jgi:serine/threonine-protein kinase
LDARLLDDADHDDRTSGPDLPEGAEPPHEELTVSFRYGEGDVISGKYRLARMLGTGGMGDVWLAHNETLDIDVAIKLMRAESGGGDAADRLLREARAAARLGHPAIVRVFDFGSTDFGEPFIVMELLEGEDLATRLADHGRLSATKAVRSLLPVAHALAAAHSKGIVHRDLKPENIFLSRTEGDRIQPKVVDFGIAKIDRGKGLRLTKKGTVLGSPGYMSPEQARGEDADHRADIWSFCVVLYEVLTGTQPFVGKNENAILYAIISQEPAPITALASGDEDLSAILTKGLAKNPDKRWSSMRDLGVALATWLRVQGVNEDIAGVSLEATWLSASTPSDGPPPPSLPVPVAVERRAVTTERPPRPAVSRLRLLGLAVVVLIGCVVGLLLLESGPSKTASPAVSATEPSDIPPAAAVAASAPTSEATAPSAATTASEIDVALPALPGVPPPGTHARKPRVDASRSRPRVPKSEPSLQARPKAPLKDPFH